MTFQTSCSTWNVNEYIQTKSHHHSYDPVLLQEAYDGLGIYIPFTDYKEPLVTESHRPTHSDSYFTYNNAWGDYGNLGHPVSHYPPDYPIFQPGYSDSCMAYTVPKNIYNPKHDALDNRSSVHKTGTSKEYTRDDYTVPNSPESITSDLSSSASSVSSATGPSAKKNNKEEIGAKKVHACDFCDRNKPYVCPCCRKCFARSDARTRHVRKEPACFAFSKKLDMIQ
ncbi:hypothetical protein CU097_007141, partial [Rhizopus azygosporus]